MLTAGKHVWESINARVKHVSHAEQMRLLIRENWFHMRSKCILLVECTRFTPTAYAILFSCKCIVMWNTLYLASDGYCTSSDSINNFVKRWLSGSMIGWSLENGGFAKSILPPNRRIPFPSTLDDKPEACWIVAWAFLFSTLSPLLQIVHVGPSVSSITPRIEVHQLLGYQFGFSWMLGGHSFVWNETSMLWPV